MWGKKGVQLELLNQRKNLCVESAMRNHIVQALQILYQTLFLTRLCNTDYKPFR